MSALQCSKRLHLEVHRPELAKVSSNQEARFATGHQVGALAREALGCEDGVLIEREWGTKVMLDKTAELMGEGAPAIYEAALKHENVLIHIDVLRREGDAWRIVEVKSSTKVKDEHLKDCAIQAWVLQGAGHPLAGVNLAHVDTSFVYGGDGNYEPLLAEEDVTTDVNDLLGQVPGWVAKAARAAAGDEPEIEVGEHCGKPYTCPFHDHCWPNRTTYPVPGLGGRKKKLAVLVCNGYEDIREVPIGELTSPRHMWIRRVTESGEPDLRDDAIRFARELPYPRYYLDFETIIPAIPIWPDTRPYQTLPFQWSCHIEDDRGTMRHAEFLDVSGDPPMRALAEALIAELGSTGPVLAYSGYENGVLNGLAKLFPDLAPALGGLVDRLEDLLPVAKKNYYHPAMLGSWSIKAVLPTVAPDMDYSELDEIQDGLAAGAAYREAIEPSTEEARREYLRERMLAYCRFDTEAMVRLLHFFAAGGESTVTRVA